MRPAPNDRSAPAWTNHKLAIVAAWVLVFIVGAIWANQKSHGGLADAASASGARISNSLANGGLDGRYVCADAGYSMSLVIDGTTGSMHLGVVSTMDMRVERHGDTVSISGGRAYDAEGSPMDEAARRAIVGANDVDLFRVGDDGQSLSVDLGDGRTAKFVKQP